MAERDVSRSGGKYGSAGKSEKSVRSVGDVSRDQCNFVFVEICEGGKLSVALNGNDVQNFYVSSKKSLAITKWKWSLFENFSGKVYSILDVLDSAGEADRKGSNASQNVADYKFSQKLSLKSLFPTGIDTNENLVKLNAFSMENKLRIGSILAPPFIEFSKFSGQDTSWVLFQRDQDFQSLLKIFPPENLYPLFAILRAVEYETEELTEVLIRVLEVLQSYFEKFQENDPAVNKHDFFRIFGSL